MNCDFFDLVLSREYPNFAGKKPHPVCGFLFHFLVLWRPSYFPLSPRSASTVTAHHRVENRQKNARHCVVIEVEKSPQAEWRANVPRETFPVPVSTTAQRRVERCLRHTHTARAEGRKHRELVDQFEHLLHDLLVEQMVVGQQFLQVEPVVEVLFNAPYPHFHVGLSEEGRNALAETAVCAAVEAGIDHKDTELQAEEGFDVVHCVM